MATKALRHLAAEPAINETVCMIWGARGSGLSHLLEAVCRERQALQPKDTVHYFDLSSLIDVDPFSIFTGVEHANLVCLDGLEAVCGDPNWERAVFHLFNNLKDNAKRLVVASHVQPSQLPFILPDLRSRVLGSLMFFVETLSDDKKQDVIIDRARAKGLDMPKDVASFILLRSPRQTAILFEMLDRLDKASLEHQRKLTIPFVKDILRL